MIKKQPNLLVEPINKLIFKLSIPVMLAGLLQATFSFIDMIFASRLGGVQVASVAVVAPLFSMILAIGNGLSLGGVSILAKHLGKKEVDIALNYAIQLRQIIVVLAIVFTILGTALTSPILKLMGISGDLLNQSIIYTRIRFLSLPFVLLFSLYISYFDSQGKMNITLKITALGLLLNILFNSIFVYIFKMGISGLAYATLLAQFTKSIILFWGFHKERHDFNLTMNLFQRNLDLKIWKNIIRIGIPLSFSQASTQFGFLLVNIFIVPYGYWVVAGFAIGNQINSIFFAPTTGVGRSLVPLIAQNWGNNSLIRIKQIIKSGMIFAFVFGIVGAFGIQLLITPLGTFLAKGDPNIILQAKNYQSLCSWGLIPWSIFQSLSGIFNGFQKTKETMIITIIRLWGLRIPALLIFQYWLTSFGEWGVWYTMFFSNLITAIMAIALYFIYVPKNIFEPMRQKENYNI